MNIKVYTLMIIVVLLVWVFPAVAMDGAQIAQKVVDRDQGQDATLKIRMLLIDKGGKKRFRSLITVVKKYGDVSKSYIRFTSPADIEGTAFLTWENKESDDDQFLYLPALQRVRRIVSSQKSNRFVNTDYTYEDLQSRDVDQDVHTVLREEKLDDHDCWVLESIPQATDDSQYGKRVTWVVKEIYLPIKTEFYDKRNRLHKILTGKEIQKIDGIWTILDAEMNDLNKNHRTLMKTDEIGYNRGIPDEIFTKGYMRHNQ
ncbi:outer membrane lipoprotein-sorting protein [Desulfobacter sp. UBA2225]|uniref:outer membrane lipoprotein-sorting protein n=1 Tax=Desulfobacter sp. UBA2225 TaxID=1961413 RepID=UPI00257D4EEA|nr:outer membrane lipoprotein-sorting protein [Desulfobacter sp. UBA2225]